MQAIWKFTLSDTRNTFIMPKGAQILCVQTQHDTPQIWAICDIDNNVEKEERTFFIYGTGYEDDSISGEYIGTFQLHEGAYIYHVFEIK